MDGGWATATSNSDFAAIRPRNGRFRPGLDGGQPARCWFSMNAQTISPIKLISAVS